MNGSKLDEPPHPVVYEALRLQLAHWTWRENFHLEAY